jgi:hypothetical protein
MFSASKSGAASTGYNLTNSLRFRSSASAFLSRTPGSAGNRRIWTWSGWVKRGQLSAQNGIFSAGTSFGVNNNNLETISFPAGDTLEIASEVSGSTQYRLITTQLFRDPSAWYHIIVAVDTTQATASNRIKLYVNGSQVTAFGTSTYPSQNYDCWTNSTNAHRIGSRASPDFDGYMDEINFIDGQALTPSSFGSFNATTGVWQPARYTGTYGTNGFYLNFTDIALTSGSNTGLGRDFSGNGNFWNTNNISVTAGVTYDAMSDVPTLTSATAANYCVMNPLTAQGNTVVDGNLKITLGTSLTAGYGVRGSLAITSGNKYYWEIQPTTASSIFTVIGIVDANYKFLSDIGLAGSNCVLYYKSSGNKIVNGTTTSYGTTYAANDIIGVAVDYSANTCTFYLNNVSQGSISLPSTSIDYVPVVGNENGVSDVFQANFGQRPFTYTPPTGFVALNTFNLPTPTILQGNKYMDATLWTGNGSSQTITNAGAFKPDLVWAKVRSSAGYFHDVVDSVRGANTRLCPNSTQAEDTASNAYLTAFNSNGFNIGSNSDWNLNSATIVGWQWQAGQGTNTSNTSGTITSTVSVNATAGFSIVTYTGNATNNATIGHGLGVAPKMVITKNRAASTFWYVYHGSLAATYNLYLNATDAQQPDNVIRSTNSTTFTVSSSSAANGTSMVAYCWAEIAGFSRFGSYTGNGSTDGPFVFTNFRPKWILVKSTGTASWFLIDTARLGYNSTNNYLLPNASSAETTYNGVDILSNGFKVRNTDSGYNDSGVTYIYAAFAESPFKNSLAR